MNTLNKKTTLLIVCLIGLAISAKTLACGITPLINGEYIYNGFDPICLDGSVECLGSASGVPVPVYRLLWNVWDFVNQSYLYSWEDNMCEIVPCAPQNCNPYTFIPEYPGYFAVCLRVSYWDGYEEIITSEYCPAEAYVTVQPEIVNWDNSPVTTSVGVGVTSSFWGQCLTCQNISWSGGGDPPTQSGGTSFTTHWDNPGDYIVYANYCGQNYQRPVKVFKVDLIVDGVSEEQEEGLGKYFGANNDDDDGNKKADYADIEVLPIDDDLVEIELKIDPMQNTGVVSLIPFWPETEYPCPIKVWSNHTKGIQLTLPYEWDLSQGPPPSKLYVEGVSGGDVDLELLYDQFQVNDTVTFHVINIETPFDYSGNGLIDEGSEEFTFNSSTPGILSFNCIATNCPVLNVDHYRWTLSIGSSPGQWYPHTSASENIGFGRISTFTFTGLPIPYNDFGRARINLIYNYDGISFTVVRDIEVFWPKFATNHPGGDLAAAASDTGDNRGASTRAPNWFYYWRQVVSNSGDSLYDSTCPNDRMGETPAGYSFARGAPKGPYTGIHGRILIGYLAQGRDIGTVTTTGIDCFDDTVQHEYYHAITQTVGYTNTAFGLGITGSTNVADNHWSCRILKPGVPPVPPLPAGRVYNHYKDLNSDGDFLDAGEDLDTDGDDVHNGAEPGTIESLALAAEPDNENGLKDYDWGNPGKNHGTIAYDD